MGAGYSANSKDVLFLKLYSEFLDKVFEQYYRILKDTGQIFFNIKSKTFNKTLNTPHWIEHLETFKKFKFKSYIIWKYSGSFGSILLLSTNCCIANSYLDCLVNNKPTRISPVRAPAKGLFLSNVFY